MKKKITLAVLLVCAVALLSSCGNTGEQEPDYNTGSGTATRSEESGEGLIEGGDIDDASQWGSVVGFE